MSYEYTAKLPLEDARLFFLRPQASAHHLFSVQLVVVIFLSALLLNSTSRAQDDDQDYDSGYEPPRVSSWPETYKDYQILPSSQSPNQRYAFIYPKRSLVEERDNEVQAKLYLVRAKPFLVLVELPINGANLCGNAHGSYNVAWSNDSSAAIFRVGIKWGPANVFVVPMVNGKAGRISDLAAEVRKLVQPSYEQSKADRFNDYFDFLFVDGDFIRDPHGKPVEQATQWSINNKHQVVIKCMCTNDPHHGSNRNWEVIFKGLWDIVQAEFIQHEYTRVPNDQLVPF